jgi:hypothetical protein
MRCCLTGRGYIWGPMAQLVHWSLENYDHVPAVRKGRKALVKQMGQLMLSQCVVCLCNPE